MHTGFISFCDRINYNIKSSETKVDILFKLKKFNVQILEKHWYKLDEKGTEHIQRIPHLACLRSNGNPYYMYFTRYDDVPIIYYIDKKVQPGYQVPRMILTKGMWDESLFSNTLLDGEMVKDAFGGWLFLINDVIAYKDVYLADDPLPKRLELAFEILDTCHTCDEIIDVCTFQVKQYANATQEGTDELIALAKTLPYTSRGLYYWPFSNKYKPKLINFNDDLIKSVYRKVKDTPDFREAGAGPAEEEIIPETAPTETVLPPQLQQLPSDVTVAAVTAVADSEKVLWLRKTENPDVYDIYDSDYAQHKDNKVGIAQVPGMATSKMLRGAFKDVTVAIYIPFVCTYNTTAEKWLPLRKFQK
jgi:hypothetical protein